MFAPLVGLRPSSLRNRPPGGLDVGDIHSMSNHAIKILENEATLKQFKANALAHSKNFDIHRIVPQYEALYNHFLTPEPAEPEPVLD